MENIFFLHISLAIPEKDGQFLFRKEKNIRILQHTITAIKNSTLLDKLIIVCAENEYQEIYTITKDALASLKFDSDFLIIEDTSPYAINRENLHFNPTLLISNRISGLFSFTFFMEQAKLLNFSKAILGWADLLPSINSATIDYLLANCEEPSFYSYKIKHNIFILPKQKTVNIIQESISELIQSHKRKMKYFESYASKKQLDMLSREKSKISSIYSITRKMYSLKKEYTDGRNFINPFLPLHSYNNSESVEKFLFLINSLTDHIYENTENIPGFLSSEMFKKSQIKYLQCIKDIEDLKISQKQRLIIDINKDNYNTLLADIQNILDKWADYLPPIIEIGNHDNPLRNPYLEEIVHYLKNQTEFIILNIKELNEVDIPHSLFKVNNLIINLRITENDQKQFLKILLEKKEYPGAKFYIETIFTRNNESFIHELFQQFEYLADHIYVLPCEKPAIKLAEESENCLWSTGTIALNSSGEVQLCEEKDKVYKETDPEELTKKQGHEKECEECYKKNTPSHLWAILMDHLFFLHKKETPDLLRLLLPVIITVISNHPNGERFIAPLLKVLDNSDCKIDISFFYFFLKKLFTDNNYNEMLNISEYILKNDPFNQKVWELIGQLEVELKEGAI